MSTLLSLIFIQTNKYINGSGFSKVSVKHTTSDRLNQDNHIWGSLKSAPNTLIAPLIVCLRTCTSSETL